MSRYIQLNCPFRSDYDDDIGLAQILVGDWTEEFFSLLKFEQYKPMTLSQIQYFDETQMTLSLHQALIECLVEKCQPLVAQEHALSWYDINNLMRDQDILQQANQISGALETNEAAFFSLATLYSVIQSRFIETHMIQRGMAIQLLDVITPKQAYSNAASLLDHHAERAVIYANMNLQNSHAKQTKVVHSAEIAAAQINYDLAVAQVFSKDGNHDYNIGGACMGKPPAISDNIANTVKTVYESTRNQSIDDDLLIQHPQELLNTFRKNIRLNLSAEENSLYTSFRDQSIILMSELMEKANQR